MDYLTGNYITFEKILQVVQKINKCLWKFPLHLQFIIVYPYNGIWYVKTNQIETKIGIRTAKQTKKPKWSTFTKLHSSKKLSTNLRIIKYLRFC